MSSRFVCAVLALHVFGEIFKRRIGIRSHPNLTFCLPARGPVCCVITLRLESTIISTFFPTAAASSGRFDDMWSTVAKRIA